MMLWYMYFCALKPMGDNFANILFKKSRRYVKAYFSGKLLTKYIISLNFN